MLVSVQVPDTYSLPTFYTKHSTTNEERALALELGAEAVARLAGTIRAQSSEHATAAVADEYKEQIRRMSYETQKEKDSLRAALRIAQQRVELLERDATTQRESVRSEIRDGFRETIASKDEQIRTLQETLSAFGNKFDALQNSLTRTFSSSKEKGQMGEAIVEGFLKKAFDCDVSVVSKEAQTADIRMTRAAGATYFWEVKNYTRMVSSEEVEKFRRDLRLHPDVVAGVLVSLRTGIVGKTRGGDIDIEFLEDGRAVLFISHLMSRDDPVFYLQTLRPFFQCLEVMRAKPEATQEMAIASLQQKSILMTNLLRNHMATLTKHRNSIVSHKKRTDAMFTEFQSFLLEAETQVGTVLRVAMGGFDEQEQIQADSERVLPLSLFQKETVAAFPAKEREFVSWFLEQVDLVEGASVSLKDVFERAAGAPKKYSEKAVRAMRSTVFQEGAWAHGARVLHGVAWKVEN